MSSPALTDAIQTFHNKQEMMDAIREIARNTDGGIRKIRWSGFNGGATLNDLIGAVSPHLADGFSFEVLAWDTRTSRLQPNASDLAQNAYRKVLELERALFAVDRNGFSNRYESLSEIFSEYLMLGSKVLNIPGHQADFFKTMSGIISSNFPAEAVLNMHGSVRARKAPHYVPCLFVIIDEHVFVRLYTDTKDQTTIWSQDTYLTTTSRSDLYHQLDTHFSKVWSEASGKVGEPIGMAAEEENSYWENIEASQHNPLPSPRIFISYRQDDSKWAASRLYDYLASVFGEASVFLDHTTLLTGSKYREAILGELNQADIILPIIGESWMSDHNLKRLHDEQDLVRIEIETALDSSRQKKLFPILVDQTQWPNSADLPESIREVVAHHSQERLNFTSFKQDARAVVAQILRLTQSSHT